jgi:hypothetical protein
MELTLLFESTFQRIETRLQRVNPDFLVLHQHQSNLKFHQIQQFKLPFGSKQ